MIKLEHIIIPILIQTNDAGKSNIRVERDPKNGKWTTPYGEAEQHHSRGPEHAFEVILHLVGKACGDPKFVPKRILGARYREVPPEVYTPTGSPYWWQDNITTAEPLMYIATGNMKKRKLIRVFLVDVGWEFKSKVEGRWFGAWAVYQGIEQEPSQFDPFLAPFLYEAADWIGQWNDEVDRRLRKHGD
jgi:hypothetical protein